jgi:predicted DNA-binding WGR domain protein
MKRHFEFVAGTSSKFWEVSVAEKAVTVCYGRIGTKGQVQLKDFESEAQAQNHADDLIRQKLKKGYVEA